MFVVAVLHVDALPGKVFYTRLMTVYKTIANRQYMYIYIVVVYTLLHNIIFKNN